MSTSHSALLQMGLNGLFFVGFVIRLRENQNTFCNIWQISPHILAAINKICSKEKLWAVWYPRVCKLRSPDNQHPAKQNKKASPHTCPSFSTKVQEVPAIWGGSQVFFLLFFCGTLLNWAMRSKLSQRELRQSCSTEKKKKVDKVDSGYLDWGTKNENKHRMHVKIVIDIIVYSFRYCQIHFLGRFLWLLCAHAKGLLNSFHICIQWIKQIDE